MPRIVIDGKSYNAQEGKTVIQTAYENGLEIPHFCWHPELSVSGNCRMCLVEIGLPVRLPDGSFRKDEEGNFDIQYFPKLQIACATIVTDNMHIRTKSQAAIAAQESVMEFLLINHPLDCPICDEAGQCKLQDYAFRNSEGESRFEEQKNHKPKRISWGPTVIYDAERCISCSRCIRFADEIAKQPVLSFVNRGDHVTIKLQDGKEFDNHYSMNVIDICPVGALTSKDFRFKSRVWDMSFNDSICPTCSRGCNIKIGVRNNEILRVEPKTNMYVNRYWMCDYGRLNWYEKINDNRITQSMIKSGNEQINSNWQEAVSLAAEKLKAIKPKEIMFIASANATNEDIFILNNFAKKIIKTNNIDYIKNVSAEFKDELLKCSDLMANIKGMTEIFSSSKTNNCTIETLAEAIKSKKIKALYVIDDGLLENSNLAELLGQLELLIVQASNHSLVSRKADIVFAASAFAEVEGTFVNVNNRVQHFTPALVTAENIRIMGMKMSRLDKFGAPNDRWTQNETRHTRPNWKILQAVANAMSAGWNYKKSEDVFKAVANEVSSFKNMTYHLLDKHQGVVLNKADNPDEIINNYDSHYYKPN